MITQFRDEYRFLSNFWFTPVKYEGRLYPSVEHAYQAAKTTDDRIRQQINYVRNPGDAKRIGKSITLREDWDNIKQDIMLNLLRQKFNYPKLRVMLLETGDQDLIEGNTWHDLYWGQCTCRVHNNAGENNLGKLLMQVREELINQRNGR